jgi:hypothetical protein
VRGVAIQALVDAVALSIQASFDAVALHVQMACTLFVTVGIGTVGFAIQTVIDAIALDIETLVDAIAFAVEMHASRGFSIGQSGNGEQGNEDKGGFQHDILLGVGAGIGVYRK